jgi:DNA-binding MarR family transcriptional regulator
VTPPRDDLLKALDEAVRKVGAQSVLISDLVATRVGLNSTDLECLDLLYLAGGITAGRLAEHTGLTTGATTAVIDRLERAGFVRRRRDPEDRRRVFVEVVPESGDPIVPLYIPLMKAMERLNARYDDEQLAVVVDFLTQAFEVGAEHIAWLQTQPAAADRSRRGRHASSAAGGERVLPPRV